MGNTFTGLTFNELKRLPEGTILHEEMITNSVRFVILRGYYCLYAFLGVPRDHPAAGKDQDDDHIGIVCHGGLSFSGTQYVSLEKVSGKTYWYGWDYGHSGDGTFHHIFDGDHLWTVKDVIADSKKSINTFLDWIKAEGKETGPVLSAYRAVITPIAVPVGRKFREV